MIKDFFKKVSLLFSDTYENRLRNYKFSLTTFNVLKIVSFIILWYASLSLSIPLFLEFGSSAKESHVFFLIVFGLEFSKVISLVLAKSEIAIKKVSNIIKGIGYFSLYIILALVSIYSGYGKVTISIQKTIDTTYVASSTDDIEFYQKKIDNLEVKIQALIPQLERSDLSIASKATIGKEIKAYEAEQEEYYLKVSELKKESLVIFSGKDSVKMFTLMSQDMGVSEKKLRFWMMIILVIIIEVCLSIMAPHISLKKPEATNTSRRRKSERKRKEIKPSVIEASSIETAQVEQSTIEVEEENKEPLEEIIEVKEEIKEEEKNLQNVEVEKKEVEVLHERETLFERFVKSLFNNGTVTWLKDRNTVMQEIGIPREKGNHFFDVLTKTKGSSGYPLIEYRKDTNHWHPNYTEQVIVNLFKTGKLKVEENNAP
jgi:hypothetical protein